MINLACSSNWECMPGAMLEDDPSADVCYDNGRCRKGECLNICEYYGKKPCLCGGEHEENIVSRSEILLIQALLGHWHRTIGRSYSMYRRVVSKCTL